MRKLLLLFFVLSFLMLKSYSQTMIAGWDFQTKTNGGDSIGQVIATGSCKANFGVGTGTMYFDGTHGSSSWTASTQIAAVTGAASGNNSLLTTPVFSTTAGTAAAISLIANTGFSENGKSIVLAFDMTNYTSLVVSYNSFALTGGFTNQVWEYSTNGTDWFYFYTNYYLSVATSFTSNSTQVITLPIIRKLKGEPTAYLRCTFNGATAAAAYNRIDNIQVNAVTEYFSKSTGNLDDLTTWTTDSTSVAGSVPTSFTADYTLFNIRNGNPGNINGTTWSLASTHTTNSQNYYSTNPKLVIDSNFIQPSGKTITGVVNVSAGRTFTITNSTGIALGFLHRTSTVKFLGSSASFNGLSTAVSASINGPAESAGNIIIDGSTTTYTGSATTYLNLEGNLTLQNSASISIGTGITSGIQIRTLGTNDQTITANGLTLNLRLIDNNNTFSKTGKLTLAPNTNLTITSGSPIAFNCTGVANQFSDGANTINFSNTSALSPKMSGDAAGYNLTGTFVTNTTGTALATFQTTTSTSTAPPCTFNNIKVNSGYLAIPATGTTLVSGTITVVPTAALNSGIWGTYANLSGNVTLQQSVIGQRGWRVFANPFTTTQTLSTIASNNSILIRTSSQNASGLSDARTYDNSSNAWADQNTSIPANTAYALFVRGLSSDLTNLVYNKVPTPFTYSVSGTLNGASISLTPSNGSGNFMLVGNPYAAPIMTKSLTGQVASTPYYVYQISQGADSAAQTTRAGSWSAVLSSSATTTIPVLGVIAYQPSNTNLFTITSTSTDLLRNGTVQTGLFGVNDTIKNVELVVNNSKGVYLDKLFVRIGEDKNKLEKLTNDNVNVYTINNNKRLAIDARKELNTTIPVGISAAAGSYTFTVANNNLDNTTVYLKDKLLNTKTELKTGSSYNFDITSDAITKGENRFEIVTMQAPAAELPVTPTAIKISVSPNPVTDILNITSTGTTNVKVMNIIGQVVKTINTTDSSIKVSVANLEKGLYIVEVKNDTETVTEKILKN